MSGQFDYVERRLEPQEEWHNKRARLNKWLFYTVEVATLLAGAAIPVVNLWAVKDAYLAGVLSAILGGVVVMAAAVGKLFKFHENWLHYRALVEALAREKELYSVGGGDYTTVMEICAIDCSSSGWKTLSPTRLRNLSRPTNATEVLVRKVVRRRC